MGTQLTEMSAEAARRHASPFDSRSAMAGCEGADRPFIAYAVQRFPALRTTFIRREVEALRRLGVPIEVVSMRPADERELESEPEAREHLTTTHYLPARPLGLATLVANLGSWVRRPLISMKNWRLGFADAGAPGVKRRLRLWLQVWRGAVMARLMRGQGRCVHVHAQFADGAATTALACARLLGVGFSFTSHTSFDSPALIAKLREAVFVASISEYDRDRLMQIGGEELGPRIRVVHCGIPVEQWPFRPDRPLHDPVRILSVGALIEKKGHEVLIDACALLRQRGRRVCCRIIGDGPLRDELARRIDAQGIGEAVELLGPLPQHRVREEFDWADLFVLASKRAADGDTDGIPVSLMESMAAGVPVVSCRIAGIPELIEDGRTGFLAEPGDAESLAECIQRCVNNRAKWPELPREARRHIEAEFSQSSEAGQLAEILRSAAHAKEQRPVQVDKSCVGG